VQPYQPSLAAAWLFQRSMALRIGQLCAPRGRRGQLSGFLPPSHINRLLRANFRVMQVGFEPLPGSATPELSSGTPWALWTRP